ncbi:MAG: Aldehyde dehydrogenase [Verrucomicrobiales bacterium]|nr:Aldehyde dehydrogenase [Verrucomicrobiales bacterium]
MQLSGLNLVAGKWVGGGQKVFSNNNPTTGEKLSPDFREASDQEVELAALQAAAAFDIYERTTPEQRSIFLRRIAEEINNLGDELIQRAKAETALPEARLIGERARTMGQLTMFADLIQEGSWIEATIDRAIPDRKPLPKADLRRMSVPLGPVVVFSASNFPLAFSVAGGDTASALAAGCPVIVKAHRGHPGTSELVARAVQKAVDACGMPAGLFSMLQGTGQMGLQLVRHPVIKAVGFTGSLRGGRALFDAASARPEPIPVYAEMGSINPVFILPGALQTKASAIAETLMQSVTLGVGQFCTNPGLVFGLRGNAFSDFANKANELAHKFSGTMLTQDICKRYRESVEKAASVHGVQSSGKPSSSAQAADAAAVVLQADAETFLKQQELHEEIFGPATLLVNCGSPAELETIARSLPGQLTATVHGTDEDLAQYKNLIQILQQKAGRLLLNGFPTGVEVCPSMQHGGPYPATTDSRSTSVGTGAIKRFVRPVCFQNFPQSALPPELQNDNPRNIWRIVDGQFTREKC